MIKISVYVSAGFDESEELVAKICELLSKRGLGIVEREDGSYSDDDLNAIVTLSSENESQDDSEEFVSEIISGQRMVAFPKISQKERDSIRKIVIPDYIPEIEKDLDEEINIYFEPEVDMDFVSSQVWECINKLEETCIEKNGGEVPDCCLSLDQPCLEHQSAVTLETLYWVYQDLLEEHENIINHDV